MEKLKSTYIVAENFLLCQSTVQRVGKSRKVKRAPSEVKEKQQQANEQRTTMATMHLRRP